LSAQHFFKNGQSRAHPSWPAQPTPNLPRHARPAVRGSLHRPAVRGHSKLTDGVLIWGSPPMESARLRAKLEQHQLTRHMDIAGHLMLLEPVSKFDGEHWERLHAPETRVPTSSLSARMAPFDPEELPPSTAAGVSRQTVSVEQSPRDVQLWPARAGEVSRVWSALFRPGCPVDL
jgi:hypothetical protein